MSFSSKTKEELARIKSDDRCCQIAMLSAILRLGGSLKLRGLEKISMEIVTESPSTARLLFSLFKKTLDIHVEVLVKDNRMLKKGHLYLVSLENAREVLETLGIITFEKGYMEIIEGIPDKIVEKECCVRAYIRGAFLGGGSISDPEKGYHMEFVTHNESYAEELAMLLSHFDILGRVIERKNNYIVYIKEGDQIVDILNVVGAHNALLGFENVRIIKMMRNNVNRIVNCETANLNKTIDASYNQVRDIEFIRDTVGLDELPELLQEIAQVRLDNPEFTLKELGDQLSKPVGKSGVNHRLKKIEAIASELRNRY